MSQDKPITIALDVMGGDGAPASPLDGAERFLKKNNDAHFLLFGPQEVIEPYLKKCSRLARASTIVHTDVVIEGNERPSVAIRKKNSTMRMALNAVKQGEAQAMVSAGNTGALMANAKLVLRALEGVRRPAIAAMVPTCKDPCVMLDLGANIECDSANLVQFALMGDAFAKVLLGLKAPRIGLLNIGSEDVKGHDTLKLAARVLKGDEHPINFKGFVEGDSISKGDIDVVVTDGFTGNVALKTAEGTAKLCSAFIKKAFHVSLFSKIGGLLAKASLKKTFNKLDPRLYNGAMFLGLGGIAVKSHGGSDAIGNENAIRVAYELAAKNINERITEEFLAHQDLATFEEVDDIDL